MRILSYCPVRFRFRGMAHMKLFCYMISLIDNISDEVNHTFNQTEVRWDNDSRHADREFFVSV